MKSTPLVRCDIGFAKPRQPTMPSGGTFDGALRSRILPVTPVPGCSPPAQSGIGLRAGLASRGGERCTHAASARGGRWYTRGVAANRAYQRRDAEDGDGPPAEHTKCGTLRVPSTRHAPWWSAAFAYCDVGRSINVSAARRRRAIGRPSRRSRRGRQASGGRRCVPSRASRLGLQRSFVPGFRSERISAARPGRSIADIHNQSMGWRRPERDDHRPAAP